MSNLIFKMSSLAKSWTYSAFILLQIIVIFVTTGYVAFLVKNWYSETPYSYDIQPRTQPPYFNARSSINQIKIEDKPFKLANITAKENGFSKTKNVTVKTNEDSVNVEGLKSNKDNGKEYIRTRQSTVTPSIKNNDTKVKVVISNEDNNVNITQEASQRVSQIDRQNILGTTQPTVRQSTKANENVVNVEVLTSNKVPQIDKQSNLDTRQSILIFIGVMSAPAKIDRRNALRQTWLSQCKQHNASCFIFSDAQDVHGKKLPDNVYVPLKQEQLQHNDLILVESPGGINFATRYLWIINWANKRYKFDFLLRVDDDYFICMDRLLLELPFRRAEKKLYWGFVHCGPPGGIRVDEGFVIVSNDLIQHFIKEQNKSLMCHAYGDQAMAMWINNINDVIYFGDPRVFHFARGNTLKVDRSPDICGSFIAIHGSYPEQVQKYWKRVLATPGKKYPVIPITYPCGQRDRRFNPNSFLGMYHAQPIPCRDNPVWNIGSTYVGRSGG